VLIDTQAKSAATAADGPIFFILFVELQVVKNL
jgi:hypothetical protein